MSKKNRLGQDRLFFIMLLPSLVGVFMFFVLPFALSLQNALINNPVSRTFVGLKNFHDVFNNVAFQLALKNTIVFTMICIPLNMIVPLFLAILLKRITQLRNIFGVIFLLPLVIPSGSMVFFWERIFGLNGLLNGIFFTHNPINWLDTPFAMAIVILIFMWKNAGFNIILYVAGLNFIPKEYYECAAVEGAGAIKQFFKITLVYLTPTNFLVFMMSFINSFKGFKEIYLLSGNYPNSSIYLLQHYMYNQFSVANYQKLASSSYILTAGFVIIVIALFIFQKKATENF